MDHISSCEKMLSVEILCVSISNATDPDWQYFYAIRGKAHLFFLRSYASEGMRSIRRELPLRMLGSIWGNQGGFLRIESNTNFLLLLSFTNKFSIYISTTIDREEYPFPVPSSLSDKIIFFLHPWKTFNVLSRKNENMKF